MSEKKMEEYAAKAKERWGDTDAFREYEKKTAGRNAEEHKVIADQMMDIFAEFGKIKDSSPESEAAVVLVRKLQDFITDHYYHCTDEILGSLGEAYGAGGEFTRNINDAAGDGAAEFASKAIDLKWEINAEIDRLVDVKREIMKFIGQIDNNSYRLLLELRYVNLCTWERIAEIMDVSLSTVYRMHGSALLEADYFYKK